MKRAKVYSYGTNPDYKVSSIRPLKIKTNYG
jgi:hypothetical protein